MGDGYGGTMQPEHMTHNELLIAYKELVEQFAEVKVKAYDAYHDGYRAGCQETRTVLQP